MVLVVEILTVSVSMANELFFLTIVVEILALLVGRKSQPLESCMLMFIEVMSIDCDSLMSLLWSVSFSLWVASESDTDCICMFVGWLFEIAMLSISVLEVASLYLYIWL